MNVFQKLFSEKERKPAKITEDGIRIYVSPNGSLEANTEDLMNSQKVRSRLERLEEIFNERRLRVKEPSESQKFDS